jgi:hypothetical protein
MRERATEWLSHLGHDRTERSLRDILATAWMSMLWTSGRAPARTLAASLGCIIIGGLSLALSMASS